MMKWYGIKVAEDGWIPPTGIAIFDGMIVHGSGLAFVNTLPPCFLDHSSGSLVDFPSRLLPALVEMLASPGPRPALPDWMLPPPPPPEFSFSTWRLPP